MGLKLPPPLLPPPLTLHLQSLRQIDGNYPRRDNITGRGVGKSTPGPSFDIYPVKKDRRRRGNCHGWRESRWRFRKNIIYFPNHPARAPFQFMLARNEPAPSKKGLMPASGRRHFFRLIIQRHEYWNPRKSAVLNLIYPTVQRLEDGGSYCLCRRGLFDPRKVDRISPLAGRRKKLCWR